jgi:hypothetical protein
MSVHEINSHLSKGFIFYYNHLYNESLREIKIGIGMIENLYNGDYIRVVNKFCDISVLIHNRNIYSLASLFILRGIYLCKKYINDDILLIQLYEKYATICLDGNNLHDALFSYEELLNFSISKGYTDKLIIYRNNIDIIQMILNQLNQQFIF